MAYTLVKCFKILSAGVVSAGQQSKSVITIIPGSIK